MLFNRLISEMFTIKLIILPFIAAFIGWLTNWFAIKMLFHPRKPINLGFFKLQGVFPKNKHKFAAKMAEVIAKELVSLEEIKAKMKQYDSNQIRAILEVHLDQFLKTKLKEAFPALAMFLSDSMLETIKNIMLEQLDTALPEVIDKYVDRMDSQINIEKMVTEKFMLFSDAKLESILYAILSSEFVFIEISGAVLGFLIGILQVAIALM